MSGCYQKGNLTIYEPVVEQIWNKYGLGNIAGGNFLIDENGIIVAVSPSIDEIRDFLIKYNTPK